MSYEFLADARPLSTNDINDAINGVKAYAFLKGAPSTLIAQVIFATDKHQKYAKNGPEEKDKKYRGDGFPTLAKRQTAVHPVWDDLWRDLFQPNPTSIEALPESSVLIKVELKLLEPFFSRNDRVFYPTENPLKREWVFNTPYLAAAGVKGLLRWAWRVCFGEGESGAERLLFGPPKGELKDGEAQQGALVPYPIFWEGDVGLEMINPHSRQSGAGTNPIKFEVVKPGAKGDLWLLLVDRACKGELAAALPLFLDALETLLDSSGLSAKRSMGWGAVKRHMQVAWLMGSASNVQEAGLDPAQEAVWEKVLDGDGGLRNIETPEICTTNLLSELTGLTKSQIWKDRPAALQMLRDLHAARTGAGQDKAEHQSRGPTLLPIDDKDFASWRRKLCAAHSPQGGATV